ncbi:helix-turn-helix transcriptional regulator [Pseudodonghicola flavimaris]|uniref:LuxR family transcriptional regulator n=1 Tax=Pseudodonghicola flavimaris TaxID=3050036 RepID=A0ABT7F0Y2_9RHOB|nr:LuxR family transcriptional regulator [Pseudodonghicola flavimaris]MDK3018248.1 LuxR family transcriptional regulator [Pseudodonghicola flavimaris]
MSVRDYLHYVCTAKSLEELWARHTEQLAGYGFDRLLYGYTRYRTETSLGDPEDFIILTNHEKAYVDGFLHQGLYFHAPMLHWALEHEGAGSWRHIAQLRANHTMTPEERKVYEFNQRMGVTAGYTISFSSVSMRSKGAISLCAREGLSQDDVEEIWARDGADILLMNSVAHLKILTLPNSGPKRALTRRQREALEWVGDGKTTQDIALLMGLTPATVEKHLRLAREALSVETTAQAVLKAALHNQMFVIEA